MTTRWPMCARRLATSPPSPIQSFFALVADDPSVQIVNSAQSWYVKRLAASTPALKDLAILSAAAPFKSGGRGGPDYYTDVKAGPIAVKDITDIYLYPNSLRAVKVDGATFANGWSARRESSGASIRWRASNSR